MTTPKSYRKKPVTIQAMRLPDPGPRSGAAAHAVTSWMETNGYPFLIGNYTDPDSLRYTRDPDDERPTRGIYIDPADGSLMIRTLEGDMRANAGWWILRGIAGEFYPCAPDIFTTTYEETTPDTSAPGDAVVQDSTVIERIQQIIGDCIQWPANEAEGANVVSDGDVMDTAQAIADAVLLTTDLPLLTEEWAREYRINGGEWNSGDWFSSKDEALAEPVQMWMPEGLTIEHRLVHRLVSASEEVTA